MAQPHGRGQELTGLRKAAIVLLSLDEVRAAQLLARLPADAARRLSAEARLLGATMNLPPQAREQVLGEFLSVAANLPGLPVPYQPPPPGRFSDFHEAPADDLLHTIRDEHPQTIALVLAHLPPERAGEILARLDPHRKVEVVKRIAGIEQTSDVVIEQVERALRERLHALMGGTIRTCGVGAVAEILHATDERVEDEVMDGLEAEAPELADQVRRVAAIFEDLLHAPDHDIRAVIEQLDRHTITLALRTAREELKRKVLRNMVDDEAEIITRDMASGSPVHVSEIEAAQQLVAEVVFRLETAGEIGHSTAATIRGGR